MIRIVPLALFAALVALNAAPSRAQNLVQGAGNVMLGTPAAPLMPKGINLDDFLWVARPLVIFADSPEDPSFQRQLMLLRDDPALLLDRRVVIIADTDPATLSDLRRRLRPNGFSFVLLDTNGRILLTRPAPRPIREISAAIDKSPLRDQELRDRRSGG